MKNVIPSKIKVYGYLILLLMKGSYQNTSAKMKEVVSKAKQGMWGGLS